METANEILGFCDPIRHLPQTQGLSAQGWSQYGSLGPSCGLAIGRATL